LSQIVFNGQPRNVEWVFVAGQPLKMRGKLVGVNSSMIVEAAQKASKRIQGDLGPETLKKKWGWSEFLLEGRLPAR
jgi:5-methylthioadenosine/S-adenosylhomocysteine deaminase